MRKSVPGDFIDICYNWDIYGVHTNRVCCLVPGSWIHCEPEMLGCDDKEGLYVLGSNARLVILRRAPRVISLSTFNDSLAEFVSFNRLESLKWERQR